MKQIKNNNEFIISCVSCIVIILVMCYFTFYTSTSSILKGTSAATTYGCLYGATLVEGENKCCQTGSTYQDGYCISSTAIIYNGNYCTKELDAKTIDRVLTQTDICGDENEWELAGYPISSEVCQEVNGYIVCDVKVTCKSKNLGVCDGVTKASNAYSSDQTFCFKCCMGGECAYSKGNYVNSNYYCRNVEMSNCNEKICYQCNSPDTEFSWSSTNPGSTSKCQSGWHTREDLTESQCSSSTSYILSFNANGGTGAPSSKNVKYGDTITLPTTTPTKSGYKFLGWSFSSTATTASYTAGGNYAHSYNSNKVLYAVWQKNSTGGGSSSSSSSSSKPSSSSSLPSSSSSKPSSSSSSSKELIENPPTGQIAIFAVWVIALGAIGYSFYYFKKLNKN